MEQEKNRITGYIDDLLKVRDRDELTKWYNQWSTNYEEDAYKTLEYKAPYVAVKGFIELGLPKNSKILDIGAGTGIVGELLQKNGFTNVDALDASPGMLEKAGQKKCYNKLVESYVSKDIRLPFDDQTYDAVIMCACLAPGHIKWDSFPQITRIVKKGGLIFWIFSDRDDYRTDEDFRDGKHEKLIQSFVDQKLWQYVNGYPKKAENYIEGTDCTLWAMTVV